MTRADECHELRRRLQVALEDMDALVARVVELEDQVERLTGEPVPVPVNVPHLEGRLRQRFELTQAGRLAVHVRAYAVEAARLHTIVARARERVGETHPVTSDELEPVQAYLRRIIQDATASREGSGS